jgi:hypothetical protein
MSEHSGAVTSHPAATRRAVLTRRIRLLVAATIGYNTIEAVVAIAAGTVASSTALISFGLDSVIEVSSAAAVAWQFTGRDPQAREKIALRVIGVSFFALAIYVTRQRGTRPARRRRGPPIHRGPGPRRGVAGRHACAVIRAATHWPRTWFAVGGRGLQTDPAVHLPVRGALLRPGVGAAVVMLDA